MPIGYLVTVVCDDDEGAYKRKIRELREDLDETGAPTGEPQAA